MKKIVYSLACCLALVACNGGGSSGGSGNGWVEDVTPASPYPTVGTYNGTPYASLGRPTGFTAAYPTAFWPNGLHNSLQIAYGNNSESAVVNLTGYVQVLNIPTPNGVMNDLCSATPVYFDGSNTWFVSAAHCFMKQKQNSNIVASSDLWNFNINPATISSGIGNNSLPIIPFNKISAVYVRQDYCQGATFSASSSSANGSGCPNFFPSDGGQGNDISLFSVVGEYPATGAKNYYPIVVPVESYPTPYTGAYVLSLGYGISTQSPLPYPYASCKSGVCGVLFSVANYQYWQQDSTPSGQGGYHYLYNSFYANTANSSLYGSGYTSLICGGDSGGGDLFWNGSNWLLLSEHTYGPAGACGTFYNYLPNGATNVSAYYTWIQSIMKDASPIADCKLGAIANCVTNGS